MVSRMIDPHSMTKLDDALARARRARCVVVWREATARTAILALPVAAAMIAVDQRWIGGTYSLGVLGILTATLAIVPAVAVWRRWESLFEAARAADARAGLKDRIASAWLFLREGELDVPKRAQISEALAHALALNYNAVFEASRPAVARWIPVAALAVIAALFVPAYVPERVVDAAVEARLAAQAEVLKELRESLETEGVDDETLRDALKQLQDFERQAAEGTMDERDAMIALGRLDEALKARMEQSGAAALEEEIERVAPHLAEGEAAKTVAEALKAGEYAEAAKRIEALGERAAVDELSDADKRELAKNLDSASKELGDKKNSKLRDDMSRGSKEMSSNDGKAFRDSAQSMSDSFKQADQFRKMASMREQLGEGKRAMAKGDKGKPGEGEDPGEGKGGEEGDGDGDGSEGDKKGGLKAGEGSADPMGDPSRLADGYRKMMEVSGVQGEGPVQSETEQTAGENAASKVGAKEVYVEYSAVAEQAIEREEIPLGRRSHVKRYFQSIRPADQK